MWYHQWFFCCWGGGGGGINQRGWPFNGHSMLQANGCLVEMSMEYCYGIIEADVHKLKDLFHIGEIEKKNVINTTCVWHHTAIISACYQHQIVKNDAHTVHSRNYSYVLRYVVFYGELVTDFPISTNIAKPDECGFIDNMTSPRTTIATNAIHECTLQTSCHMIYICFYYNQHNYLCSIFVQFIQDTFS